MEGLPTTSSACETSVSSTPESDGTASGEARARVQVRYWASIKAAAGRASDDVSGATVAEVIDAVRRLHVDVPRFGEILDVCSVLVGERPLGNADPARVSVADGATVDLLPPFAGGCR